MKTVGEMNKVPLAKVAKFINGRAFKPEEWHAEGLPIIRIQNLTGTSEESNYFNGEYDERNLVKRGDILISWSASLGVYEWQGNDAILNQHIFKVQLNSSVDKRYFYHAATDLLNEMSSHVHGSTMQHITKDKFDALEIPLPSLDEQKRIAAILDKADRLRRQRRFAQTLSDSFLQSVFIKMFGDPVSNPMNWKEITVESVLASIKDGQHVSPAYSKKGVPFLSTRNIRKGEVVWEDLKFISNEEAISHWKKCKPQMGDVLYTKGGTTGFAKVVDFKKEFAVWVHLAVLTLNKEVNPLWFENMLNTDYCYKQSQELTFGIVNRDLGLKRIPRIKMYLPPLPLQEKFAAIVHKFERVRRQQREATRQAEHLFQTLLHRAFRGEL